MKSVQNWVRSNVGAIAVILLVLMAALITVTVYQVVKLRDIEKRLDETSTSQQLVYNEITNQKQLLKPVVSAEKNLVFIPEMRLSLPYNQTTKTLQYYEDLNGNIRLQSTLVADYEMRTMSCADMVRIKVEESPDEYSPEQKLAYTVPLSDGRTLQVYASSYDDCQLPWQQMSPQQIAEEFKQASSY